MAFNWDAALLLTVAVDAALFKLNCHCIQHWWSHQKEWEREIRSASREYAFGPCKYLPVIGKCFSRQRRQAKLSYFPGNFIWWCLGMEKPSGAKIGNSTFLILPCLADETEMKGLLGTHTKPFWVSSFFSGAAVLFVWLFTLSSSTWYFLC